MKNLLLMSIIVFSGLFSNAFGDHLMMAAIKRDLLTNNLKPLCSSSVCNRIDFDEVQQHLFELKTYRNNCSQLKNILHWDIVLIAVNEKHLCHCECKF